MLLRMYQRVAGMYQSKFGNVVWNRGKVSGKSLVWECGLES